MNIAKSIIRRSFHQHFSLPSQQNVLWVARGDQRFWESEKDHTQVLGTTTKSTFWGWQNHHQSVLTASVFPSLPVTLDPIELVICSCLATDDTKNQHSSDKSQMKHLILWMEVRFFQCVERKGECESDPEQRTQPTGGVILNTQLSHRAFNFLEKLNTSKNSFEAFCLFLCVCEHMNTTIYERNAWNWKHNHFLPKKLQGSSSGLVFLREDTMRVSETCAAFFAQIKKATKHTWSDSPLQLKRRWERGWWGLNIISFASWTHFFSSAAMISFRSGGSSIRTDVYLLVT